MGQNVAIASHSVHVVDDAFFVTALTAATRYTVISVLDERGDLKIEHRKCIDSQAVRQRLLASEEASSIFNSHSASDGISTSRRLPVFIFSVDESGIVLDCRRENAGVPLSKYATSYAAEGVQARMVGPPDPFFQVNQLRYLYGSSM